MFGKVFVTLIHFPHVLISSLPHCQIWQEARRLCCGPLHTACVCSQGWGLQVESWKWGSKNLFYPNIWRYLMAREKCFWTFCQRCQNIFCLQLKNMPVPPTMCFFFGIGFVPSGGPIAKYTQGMSTYGVLIFDRTDNRQGWWWKICRRDTVRFS